MGDGFSNLVRVHEHGLDDSEQEPAHTATTNPWLLRRAFNVAAFPPSERTVPVCAENLDSDVLVMQPANQGIRHNASDPLNWARDRRILGQ